MTVSAGGQAGLTGITLTGALDADRRAALAAELAHAGDAVVLRIDDCHFPLPDMTDRAAMAAMADLARLLAAKPGPTVAFLRGRVAGVALELALAAQVRLADPQARLCFPSVSLGLAPGAGATQRLPRLIGAGAALDLLLTGREVTGAEALSLGLVDQLVTGMGELSLARLFQDLPNRRKPVAGRDWLAAVARARATPGPAPAAARIIDAVEMALMVPPEQGFIFERVVFDDLAQTPLALALIHAEQAFAFAAGPGKAVSRLALWGVGPATRRIARAARDAGLALQLAADNPDLLGPLHADLQAQAGPGTELPPPSGIAALAEADLVLAFDALPPGAARSVLTFGAAGAGQVGLDLHGALAEITDAPGARADTAAQAVWLAARLGLVPVRLAAPVAAPLARARSAAMDWAAAQGFAPDRIARAMAEAGLSGPVPDGAGSDDPLALRLMAALANRAAHLLDQGAAQSALQLDAAAIGAGLCDKSTGGPLHWANQRGLLVLRRDLADWSADGDDLWSPTPRIAALLAKGQRFS